MRMRNLAALPLAAALIVGPVLAGPAEAAGRGPAKSSVVTAKKTASPKPAKPAKPAKPVVSVKPAKPAKPVKPVPFGLNGTLTGVDLAASTVTVLVQGGKAGKAARGTSQTVAVAPTTRIRLNDAPGTLGALPVGAHVSVSGTVTGAVRTAAKINAASLDEQPEQPEPSEPQPSEPQPSEPEPSEPLPSEPGAPVV